MKILYLVGLFFIPLALSVNKINAQIRYVKPVSSGLADGSSWANASSDLQLMINNSPAGGQVWVAAGTYKPQRPADNLSVIDPNNRNNAFVLKENVVVYGGFLGVETLLRQRNYEVNETILNGDIGVVNNPNDNCKHLVISSGPVGYARLDGFTITKGSSNFFITQYDVTVNGYGIDRSRGGGFYIRSSSPAIANCKFLDNSSGLIGGAMYLFNSSPIITNCNFYDNWADDKGGAIYSFKSAPNLSSNTFSLNNADEGAAIYNVFSSTNLSNCLFFENQGVGSGAVYNFFSDMKISNSTFSGNVAILPEGGGGAMYNNDSDIDISNCLFTNNKAKKGGGLYNIKCQLVITNTNFSVNVSEDFLGIIDGRGGGIFCENTDLEILNSKLMGNSAIRGGGLFINGGNSVLTSCLFSGNKASINGAAIANYERAFTTVLNCTFSGNNAEFGAIMCNEYATIAIRNIIGWGNFTRYGNDLNIHNHDNFSITNSNVSDCILEGGYPGGTNIINVDPMFVSPESAMNAPTILGDYHILPASPALDIGNNNFLPANHNLDLDGNPRIVRTNVDLGAYELFCNSPIVVPGSGGIVYVDYKKSGNGSSWSNALPSLAEAIKEAKVNSSITQIWVAKGKYYPTYSAGTSNCDPISRDNSFVLVSKLAIYGGFAGVETAINQRDINANPTVLSGDIGIKNNNDDNVYHVVIGAGNVETAILDGFIIRDGNANGSNSNILINGYNINRRNGGGIYLTASSPTISNCVFENNFATSSGGAMFNSLSASPHLSYCNFINNSANIYGGGLNNDNASPVLVECIFRSNSAQYGGSMRNNSSSPQIFNCNFFSSEAEYGGAIQNSTSTTLVSNSTFCGNTAQYGGAMDNYDSDPSISGCIFSGNLASINGGGMNNENSSPVIINCTFGSNRAINRGGGLNNVNDFPTIRNSILWGNTATNGGNAMYPLTGGSNVSYSVIQGGYASGTNIVNIDPLYVLPELASLAPSENGNYRLQKCSQAINLGNNSFAPSGNDLDGHPRILNSTVDMGAYENENAMIVVTPNASGIVFVNKQKSGNGSSWNNALPELADALKAAKTNAAIKQIWVAKGTYLPQYDAVALACNPVDNRDKSFVLVDKVDVYGGFGGGENALNQRNITTNITILSGDIGVSDVHTDNSYHVVIASGTVGSGGLNGFTIIHGNANGSNTNIVVNGQNINRRNGGGLYVAASSPKVVRCIFTENNALQSGGATYNTGSPVASFNTCSFINNHSATYGGAIENNVSSPDFTRCVFTGNTAQYGGAIRNNSASPDLLYCDFFSNTADYGGGIENLASSPKILNCIFSGNTADYGAGVDNFNNSNPTITNCLFSGNIATNGGGMNNENSTPVITNCTFGGNRALNRGGGIHQVTTFATIRNCIIWGNSAFNGGNSVYPITGGANVNFSLIQGGYASGTNITTTDPLFELPLAAVSAPTIAGNYRLKKCSPSINTGSNTYAPAGNDLDANLRTSFGTVDRGAYEKLFAEPFATGVVYVNKNNTAANGDGSSWSKAVTELSDALLAAKTNSNIKQIWVAKGTYMPLYLASDNGSSISCPVINRDNSFVLVSGVKVYGGFSGHETNINDRDVESNPTILSGDIYGTNNYNSFHVVVSAGSVVSGSDTARLDGFIITKGRADTTTVTGVTVNGITISRRSGGGMFNRSSSPVISNCQFIDNTNTRDFGGGMYNVTSSPDIQFCTFLSNSASTAGGLYNSASSPKITNCIFSGNSATQAGGAIVNQASSAPVILNSLITGNYAALNGGGIYNNNAAPVLTNTTISGNMSVIYGGGLYNLASSVPVLNNCIVWGNQSGTGNAIYPAAGPIISTSIIEGGYAPGTNIFNVDPVFVDSRSASLSPNVEGDYRLSDCSPAINIGNNAAIPSGVVDDLDKSLRIIFEDVDLGAYEQLQNSFKLGDTSVWRGVNSNWNDKINWCGGFIPSAFTSVYIPATANDPVISTGFDNQSGNITFGAGTSITVSSGSSFTINGKYNNQGCSILNNGKWVMAGIDSSVNFPGVDGTVVAMEELIINSFNNVVFDKSFSITGALVPMLGNIELKDDVAITLKSTSTKTASLDVIQEGASVSYVGTGAFIVERYIHTGTAVGQHDKSWQFLSTPANGQTFRQSWQENGSNIPGYGTILTGTGTGFDITTTLPSVKYYNDVAGSWTAVNSTIAPIQNNLGYMVFVRGDRSVTTHNAPATSTTLRTRGKLFSPTDPPPSITVGANRFQSIGNPYASRIEFSKVLDGSTGINDVFYVWDPLLNGSYGLGGYQIISGVTGYQPTAGVTGTFYEPATSYPYLESGQAFFVRGGSSGGMINFSERVKASGSRLVNRPPATANRVQINVSLFTSSGAIADGTIIVFDANLGNGLTEDDAIKITNPGENFGTLVSNTIVGVEARELISENDTIFFYQHNLKPESYRLRFTTQNLPVHLHAILIDRFTGSATTLTPNVENDFHFNVNTEEGSSAPNRFILVFKEAGVVAMPLLQLLNVEDAGDYRTIKYSIENGDELAECWMEHSIDGRNFLPTSLLHPAPVASIQEYVYRCTLPGDGCNFYRINGRRINGQWLYSNIGGGCGDRPMSIVVHPNPVISKTMHVKINNAIPGDYQLQLTNAIGQLVYRLEEKVEDRNTSLILTLNKNLPAGIYFLRITNAVGLKKYFKVMIR